MNIITKDFPVTGSEPTAEFPNGSFEVILSAPTLDRDGEVVDAKAFEPLPDHITFDTDHSMTVDSVVGSGRPFYAADGTLRVRGGFAADERSQTVRQKVLDGHIRTTSVTMLAAQRDNDEKGVPHIVKAELLNGTFTPVPSNREAVVLTAKSIYSAVAKAGARNSAADQALVQQIHDLAVALGAMCDGEPDADDTGKAVTDSDGKTPNEVRAEYGLPLLDVKAVSDKHAQNETPSDSPTEAVKTLDETETKSADEAADAAADEAAAPAADSADDKSVPLSRVALLEHALEL